MTRFTGLMLFVAAVSAWAAFLQWRSTEHSIEVSNRAWVGIKEATLTKELQAGERPSAIVMYVNKGNTPALRVKVRANMGFTDRQPSEPMANLPGVMEESVGVFLPESDKVGTPVMSTEAMPEDFLRQVNEGKKRLYVWGVIEYEDVFGNAHTTRYCLTQQPGAGRDLDVCPMNNTAD
jgi:hypothetical protein